MSAIHRPKAGPLYTSKWGTFGTFNTDLSYPIEYLLTTLRVSELRQLTTAQELRPPGDVDFKLLMQRDIDLDRVRKEIVKYLSPEGSPAEVRTHPAFFPPVLAAVVPVHGMDMQEFLPPERVYIENDPSEGDLLVRDWGQLLRLRYVPRDGASLKYRRSDDQSEVNVEPFPVQLQYRRKEGPTAEPAIQLVIIDGQHRLKALMDFASASPDRVQDIVLPVCIINAPYSTTERHALDPAHTIRIPQVFRELFVDVNKNAVQVGGHFSTLLSDRSVGNLAAREFCDVVLKEYGKEGLALVEWNVRSLKDSTQITRDYSATSIGIIEKALEKSLAGKAKRGLLKRVLSLGLIEPQLYPDNAEFQYPNPVEWDKFSPAQKVYLEQQVRNELVKAGLVPIFFESEPYRVMLDEFTAIVRAFRREVDEKKPQFPEIKAGLDQILEYVPVLKDNVPVQVALSRIELAVKERYEANTNPILRFAVFQRALISAWLEFVNLLRTREDLALSNMTAGFVQLMNVALAREKSAFSRARRYMNYSVFRLNGQIKPTEGTRSALSSLLLAFLGTKGALSNVLKAAGLSVTSDTAEKLRDFGFEHATTFLHHYKSQRRDEFVSSWSVDFSIAQDEREELEAAEKKLEDAKHAYRAGTATKEVLNKAEDDFWTIVKRHVGTDLENAAQELKAVLGYEADIVLDGELQEIEEEE